MFNDDFATFIDPKHLTEPANTPESITPDPDTLLSEDEPPIAEAA